MDIQVQRDIVSKLSQVLNNPENTQEALAINLMNVLEEATSDPNLQVLMPAETLSLLDTLKKWVSPLSSPSLPDSIAGAQQSPENKPVESEDTPDPNSTGTADTSPPDPTKEE
jgi:hypothetical protein